ncbi:MAG: hypothetical protein M1839_003773 [Geoglossum umbratile]|nr:MAG: hypothetical protein M1839_003773 [Geoglossum umbratile]
MVLEAGLPPQDVKPRQPAASGQHVCLNTDPFQSQGNQEIIDLINRLLECGGINETIGLGLPQIVIVGDQSSGKSSLLQSLTGIPFPVGDGLCTRFPTQIVSRQSRSGPERIKVSVHENPLLKTAGAGIDAFARTLPSLTSTEFDELIKEASALLGLAQPGGHGFNALSRNFSTSTLKIEVTGPSRTPFAITDLPGLFHASTAMQNTSDMTEIRALVRNYIEAPGTIIVGVANGLVNIATQEIFEMAGECDGDGSRTVGVITRCDMVTDTTEILKLARNQTLPLKKHGWFVVRNRSTQELEVGGSGITNEERHIRETNLFSTDTWSQLLKSHRGVHALRDYLSTLLLQHSRSKLPGIAQAIRSHILTARFDLQTLGHSRDSAPKQRQFLQGVVGQFQTAAESALSGHYSSSVLLRENMLKLRKRVAEANEAFAHKMITKGHMVEFKEVERIPLTLTGVPVPASSDRSANSPFANVLTAVNSGFRNPSPAKQPTTPQPTTLFGTRSGATTPKTVDKDPRGIRIPQSTSVLFGGESPKAPQTGFSGHLHSSNLFSTAKPTEGGPAPPSTLGRSSSEVRTDSYPFVHLDTNTADLHPNSPERSPEEVRLGDYLQRLNVRQNTPARSFFFPFGPSIDSWIKEEIANNRGTELPGTPNPGVVPALFRRQTTDWESHAREHLQNVQSILQAVTKALLLATCKDDAVRINLEVELSSFHQKAYAQSEDRLDALIQDLREKPLQTNNPLFAEKVQFARRLRFENALARYLQRTGQLGNGNNIGDGDSDGRGGITLWDPSSLFDALHISNSENLADEIHDTLKSYYDITVVNFVEFVNNHIVERYVSSPDGPVRLFSPHWVAGLSDKDLARLAGDDKETLAKRKEGEDVLEGLLMAEKILRDYGLDSTAE